VRRFHIFVEEETDLLSSCRFDVYVGGAKRLFSDGVSAESPAVLANEAVPAKRVDSPTEMLPQQEDSLYV